MIDVVGIGDAGLDSLGPYERGLVEQARVLVGGRRHLELVPQEHAPRRISWGTPFRESMPQVLRQAGLEAGGVVVLSSGDPLRSGVGTTLIELLGRDQVRVHPSLSSDTLARARMGWSAEETRVVTVVGRDIDLLRPHLTPRARLVVLSSGGSTPETVARLLLGGHLDGTEMTVLWHLGGEQEGRWTGTPQEWLDRDEAAPALNVICLGLPDSSVTVSTTPGLPDDLFEHDGQLTKAEVRIHALAALRPVPGQLLWDLGGGAGSVGIEWARHDPSCRTVAVERDADRADALRHNAARLGVPGLDVRVSDNVTAVAKGLPDPDAVFIGGGLSEQLVDAAWSRLPRYGRLVAHAVTLESERLLTDAWRRYGGTLRRISVERAEPLGSFSGWVAARPVVQWAATKEYAEVDA